MKRQLRAIDLFCGAGGSTTGAKQSGLKVVLAVNHWYTAIQTHEANHPDVRHICARIDDIDPRHDKSLPNFDLLLASPECTHHSNARGSAPIDDQKRATPWHVCLWAEVKRPKWIVVENVREFRDWAPIKNGKPIKSRKGEIFKAWVDCLKALGYQVEHRLLNSADYGEATKRIRLFVVCRLGKGPIPWPVPTHTKEQWRGAYEIINWDLPCPSIFGRKRPLEDKTLRRIDIGCRKYVGRPDPFLVKLRGTSTVGSIGDPCPTLTAGGGHVGLAAPFQLKAMGRNPGATKGIDEPLPTVVAARENHALVQPFLVPHWNERDGQVPRTHGIGDPAPAVTSRGAGSLVVPFMVDVHNQRRDDNSSASESPLPTIVTKPGNSLVLPFMVSYHGGEDPGRDGTERSSDPREPLPTVDTQNRFAVAAPYLVDTNHGEDGRSSGGRVHSTNEPLGAITATRGRGVAVPFLTNYFGTGQADGVDEPLSTCTAKGRHGFALAIADPDAHYDALLHKLQRSINDVGRQLIATMRELGIGDIGFRMLQNPELAAAQGFPLGYQLCGNKAEQTRQIGNAVPPGFIRAICNAIQEAA